MLLVRFLLLCFMLRTRVHFVVKKIAFSFFFFVSVSSFLFYVFICCCVHVYFVSRIICPCCFCVNSFGENIIHKKSCFILWTIYNSGYFQVLFSPQFIESNLKIYFPFPLPCTCSTTAICKIKNCFLMQSLVAQTLRDSSMMYSAELIGLSEKQGIRAKFHTKSKKRHTQGSICLYFFLLSIQ